MCLRDSLSVTTSMNLIGELEGRLCGAFWPFNRWGADSWLNGVTAANGVKAAWL